MWEYIKKLNIPHIYCAKINKNYIDYENKEFYFLVESYFRLDCECFFFYIMWWWR